MRDVPSRPPLVFVEDLDAPQIDDHDRHHLHRVLRVRTGDDITIANGSGGWRAARFGAVVEPSGEVNQQPALDPAITIAFAVVKGERPELVAQKLTELGADRIVPFIAARSVVRWERDKAEHHVERLRRVVREAAMQCRRSRLPVVEPLALFDDVVGRPRAALADRDGAALTLDNPIVLIGPEGGWSDDERSSGRTRVGLSDHVLRADTAAITACSLLSALRSGLVGPAYP